MGHKTFPMVGFEVVRQTLSEDGYLWITLKDNILGDYYKVYRERDTWLVDQWPRDTHSPVKPVADEVKREKIIAYVILRCL